MIPDYMQPEFDFQQKTYEIEISVHERIRELMVVIVVFERLGEICGRTSKADCVGSRTV